MEPELLLLYKMSLHALMTLQFKIALFLIIIVSPIIPVIYQDNFKALATRTALPKVIDNMLRVELVTEGLSFPTSMSFLDDRNLLVLEKNGSVRLVRNGTLQNLSVASFPINSYGERGLLGIATTNGTEMKSVTNFSENTSIKNDIGANTVFLYYTESIGNESRNRVYRFQWNGESLVDQTRILDLPAGTIPQHVGGKLVINSNGNLYAVIGDISRRGMLQNIKDGSLDNTSAILRVNPNGSSVKTNPFFNNGDKMNSIFAYGVRNSFGMALDPLTGNLWDTENGHAYYDEINIVKPGFNSGWVKVMGPISRTNVSENDLVNFPGSAYEDPVFSWYIPVAVTAIEFLNSSELGNKYANNIFVGDYNNGRLYYFEVNDTRTGIKIGDFQTGPFVADNSGKVSAMTFGEGFGRIADIKTGRDGYLYILSFEKGEIYRIVPRK